VPTGRLGHPLANAQTWDELKDASWVLNLTDGSRGNHLVRWLAANSIDTPANMVRCASPTVMLELMRRTDHIGFGPMDLLSDDLFGAGLQQFNVAPCRGRCHSES
jgi:DNA-binding transcriptional LysR family regulator